MRRLICFFLPLLLALLGGCASTTVLQPVPADTSKLARVTFIRYKLEPVIREYRLTLHETHVANLADKDAVAVYLPVGDNYIHLDIQKEWPFWFTLKVPSTEPMYVVIAGESTFAGAQSAGAGQTAVNIQLSRRYRVVSRQDAEALLQSLGKRLP